MIPYRLMKCTLFLHSVQIFLQPPFLHLRRNDMGNRRNRMIEHHSRAGKAHHLTDFLPHLRFVAMHSAVRAECLRFHKRTMIASGLCIAFQFSTFAAEFAFGVVLLSAVQRDHLRHHLLFLFPLPGCSIHIRNLSCFILQVGQRSFPLGSPAASAWRQVCQLIRLFSALQPQSAHPPVFHAVDTVCNPHR